MIYHNRIGRDNNGDTSMITPLILHEAGITVKYTSMQQGGKNRYLHQNCIIFPQHYQSQELYIDLELVNTQSGLWILRTANDYTRLLELSQLMYMYNYEKHSAHYYDLKQVVKGKHSDRGVWGDYDQPHQKVDYFLALPNYMP